MKPTSILLAAMALPFVRVAETEAQQALPLHELVGRRFVPSDVDLGRPVYEASFDDPHELKNWKQFNSPVKFRFDSIQTEYLQNHHSQVATNSYNGPPHSNHLAVG